MAFAIGIMVALVAGGAAYGPGLPYLYRMWSYYATDGANPTTWAAMETGGAVETTWANIDLVGSGPLNITVPAITGDPYEGETLSVSDGTWNPRGGIISRYEYQWYSDGSPIEGATTNTYVLTSADTGAYITAQSRAITEGGTTPADADTVGPVIGIPDNTVLPLVTGTPTVGELLSVSDGTWTGGGTIVYTYQWTADDVDISGATNNTYTLTAAEVDAIVACDVTATNEAGATDAESSSVGPIVAA